MKAVLILLVLFCAIALPARAELTPEDLDKIRLIVKEEVKAEIELSERRMKTYIDLKIEAVEAKIEVVETKIAGVEKRVTHTTNLTYALIALVVIAVGIPQIIVAWQSTRNREQARINQELRQEIEALKRQWLARS